MMPARKVSISEEGGRNAAFFVSEYNSDEMDGESRYRGIAVYRNPEGKFTDSHIHTKMNQNAARTH